MVFLKTPHMITLIKKHGRDRFDPHTGQVKSAEYMRWDVPCLVTKVTQARQFEAYGSRDKEVIIARLMQPVAFDAAEYRGRRYKPLESIDAPIKGAVRLEAVVDE